MESIMMAIVYEGAGKFSFKEVPKPTIESPTDAIVKITTTTICGTDLHILKGDVPEVKAGTILGHEGIGIIEEVGSSVRLFKKEDKVIIKAISPCGYCEYCKRQMYGRCVNGGGWILGHLINGTHAEYVRVPFADFSLVKAPADLDDLDLVPLSDSLPTGYECGVVRGQVKIGDIVAIIGAGPVGLSALITAKLYSPSTIIVIDIDENRLNLAKELGADYVINSKLQDAIKEINKITNNEGVNVAIEAVGIPTTFELATQIVKAGGRIANIGVHGHPAILHIEKLWDKDVTITTQLLDGWSVDLLLKMIKSKKLNPRKLVSHIFSFNEFEKAYQIFSRASENRACKVAITKKDNF